MNSAQWGALGLCTCVFFILATVFGGLWGAAVQENRHYKPTDCFVVDNGINKYINGCNCCCSHEVPTPCPPPPSPPATFDDDAMTPSFPVRIKKQNEPELNLLAPKPKPAILPDRNKNKKFDDFLDDEFSNDSPKFTEDSYISHDEKQEETRFSEEIQEQSEGRNDIVRVKETEKGKFDPNMMPHNELLINQLQEVEYHDNETSIQIESEFCSDDCFSPCCTSECCNIRFTCYAAWWDLIVYSNESEWKDHCPDAFQTHYVGNKQGSNSRPVPIESKERAIAKRDLRPPNTTQTCYFDIRNCRDVEWGTTDPKPLRTSFIVFVSIFGTFICCVCAFVCPRCCPGCMKGLKDLTEGGRSPPSKLDYMMVGEDANTSNSVRRNTTKYDYSKYSNFETGAASTYSAPKPVEPEPPKPTAPVEVEGETGGNTGENAGENPGTNTEGHAW